MDKFPPNLAATDKGKIIPTRDLANVER
jgi:hypothetical protein